MVCAAPWARGYGIGTALARLAVNELLERGMETAHLTTDDFRLPAIRTYLEAGFVPQRSRQRGFSGAMGRRAGTTQKVKFFHV